MKIKNIFGGMISWHCSHLAVMRWIIIEYTNYDKDYVFTNLR